MRGREGRGRASGLLALLLASGCGVDISAPDSVPYVEVWDLAEFSDFEQDYARALLRADSDGDGADELIAGSPAADPDRDGVVLFVSLADFGVDNAVLPWRDPGETSAHHDEFGAALALADWNADGALDLAVGDPGADVGAVDRPGEAWVFFGPIDTTRPLRLRAARRTSGGRFGATLASGDFDGDGFLDLAVGAPRPSGGAAGAEEASVTVFFGPDLARRETWVAAEGGGRFGAALVPVPADSGSATLVVGAPEAVSATGPNGDAFAWERASGPGSPLRLAAPAPADQGFGYAGELGDFDGDGRRDLALVAPRGQGGLYLFDPADLSARGRAAMPAALAQRQGAPVSILSDVSGDGADELVLLSAGSDEPCAVLFSPGRAMGRAAAHARLDFAASAALAGNLDIDEDPELLLATPSSYKPTGGFAVLRVVDFSWRPTILARPRAAPIRIPGVAALREELSIR